MAIESELFSIDSECMFWTSKSSNISFTLYYWTARSIISYYNMIVPQVMLGIIGSQAILEHLDLSGNAVTAQALNPLAGAPRLQGLNLSRSGLAAWPDALVSPQRAEACQEDDVGACHWPALRELDLAENQLAHVHPGFVVKFDQAPADGRRKGGGCW